MDELTPIAPEPRPEAEPSHTRAVLSWLRLGLVMAILVIGLVPVIRDHIRAYPTILLAFDPAPIFYLAGILAPRAFAVMLLAASALSMAVLVPVLRAVGRAFRA